MKWIVRVCVCRSLFRLTAVKVNSPPPSLLRNLYVMAAGTQSQVSSYQLVIRHLVVALLYRWDDDDVLSSPVVKKNNVLQLHVDEDTQHSVGPKQSRSAGSKETVYLGGVPGESTLTSLASPCFIMSYGESKKVVFPQRITIWYNFYSFGSNPAVSMSVHS